jgi:ATP-dependent Lon protease
MDTSHEVLPLLPLRDIVVFPHMVAPLFVGRNKSVSALSSAMNKDKRIFLATQRNAGVDNPSEKDICDVGVVGTVLQLLRLPDGTVKALIEGKQRARINRYVSNPEYFEVELSVLADVPGNTVEIEALMRAVNDSFSEYAGINKSISKELLAKISAISDPSKLADTVASHFSFKIENKQSLLETVDLDKRLSSLVKLIKLEIEVFQMDQRIKGRVKEQMEKTQKNYYLNEQMRAIRKEMGGEDEMGDELKDLEKKIKRKRMSKEASAKARQEFKKLKMMTPMSAEATVVRNYIDWMISLPWFNKSRIRHDLIEAEKILNEDHYGLDKPKERILEYLAVQTLVKKLRGPILCLVGPPGVGKTSLARSVARATGRKFVRLSLGGVRDEAEIRGHRRTYIGAMPGKIIQSLKKAGVNNPVFCLDEVDKMSMDFRGDPSSALLEVLDPEQNYSFNDHYLDMDYDLSDVMFITTANTLGGIPIPLQDRMEIIQLSSYTEFEKLNIALKYLIPRQKHECGLDEVDFKVTENAVRTVIHHYTKEAGVRSLEREIASLCRKMALRVVKEGSEQHIELRGGDVPKYLGVPKFRLGKKEDEDSVGLTHGLSVSEYGGDILDCEVSVVAGKGKLVITGLLEKGMEESAQAAMSYIRSRAGVLKLEQDFYQKIDVHVHFPDFIRKDGPSAGVTMATSIASALTRISVRSDVAMTGEITLRGRVMPIGGLKEKLLAAHRNGIKTVLIPKDNRKDLREIPRRVLRALRIVLVDHMDDVLREALTLDDPTQLFGERRLHMEYVNGEFHQGDSDDSLPPPSPLKDEAPGEQPGMA